MGGALKKMSGDGATSNVPFSLSWCAEAGIYGLQLLLLFVVQILPISGFLAEPKVITPLN